MLTSDNMQTLTDRQYELIKATIGLIGEEGIASFSIRKLAKRVGITEPAVYRHFQSKDDLMITLASYIVEHWHSLLREIELPVLPAVDRIGLIFRSVIQYFSENRLLARTVVSSEVFNTNSEMMSMVRKLKVDGTRRFVELIREGQASGELHPDIDPEGVPVVFFGAVRWLLDDWILEEYPDDLPERWDAVWRVLVRLLRP